MTEPDEIQLVDRTAGDEEEGEQLTEDDRDSPPCMKITSSDAEESEPRVQVEWHVKHPGRLKMRLRVRFPLPFPHSPTPSHFLLLTHSQTLLTSSSSHPHILVSSLLSETQIFSV